MTIHHPTIEDRNSQTGRLAQNSTERKMYKVHFIDGPNRTPMFDNGFETIEAARDAIEAAIKPHGFVTICFERDADGYDAADMMTAKPRTCMMNQYAIERQPQQGAAPGTPRRAKVQRRLTSAHALPSRRA